MKLLFGCIFDLPKLLEMPCIVGKELQEKTERLLYSFGFCLKIDV